MKTTPKPNHPKDLESRKILRFRDLRAGVLVPIGICVILLAWLYLPTFRWWWSNWTKKDYYYDHAFVVPVISAWVIWLKRKNLASLDIRGSAKGFLFLVPLLAAVVLVSWAGPSSPLGLTFPLVLAGIVLVLFGASAFWELAFPVGYLYFMCVLPGFLLVASSFKIQLLSTIGGTMMLRLVGLDAVRDGMIINLPDIQVIVGAPCSGFRLMISMVALAVLFIYLTQGRKWAKALLLISIVPISVILNSFRVALTAVVGQYRGLDAMHAFHDWAGYIMLIFAFLILWLLGRLFRCEGLNSTLSF